MLEQTRTQRQAARTSHRLWGAARSFDQQPLGPVLSHAGHSISRISVFAPQTKLSVNTPGDYFEREADRVADQVMQRKPDGGSLAASLVQRCACQDKSDHFQTKSTGEPAAGTVQLCPCEDEEVQRKESDETKPAATNVSGIVEQGLSGGGQALDSASRSFMEDRFEHNFSSVRIHTDNRASQSAEDIAARAYTFGNNIAFRAGEYAPGSREGKRLLAHELTHVVQQNAAAPRGSSVQRAVWEPYRTPDASFAPGHTAGDDYQGPNGTITHPGTGRVGVGGIGGSVSYGCYCGPGGDASGSRCGPGAPAVDEIDEQCRQHDSNYVSRHVDSGSAPGTHNMFTSIEGWRDAEDADQQLHDSVQNEMQTHGGSYTPTTRLYGQGIQGIFGARAGISHAGKWGVNKVTEAQVGLSDAYNWGSDRAGQAYSGVTGAAADAFNWGEDKAEAAAAGVTGAAGDAMNWGEGKADQAALGITNAAASAETWGMDRASQAYSGVTGAAADAMNWGEGKAEAAAAGVTGAAGDAMNWGSGLAGQAAGGIGSFIDGASHWGSMGDALSGIGTGISDAANWGGGVAEQAASGVSGTLGNTLGWLGDTTSQAASGVSSAEGSALDWLGNTGREAASGISAAAGQAAGWIGSTANQAETGAAAAAGQAGNFLGTTAGESASGAEQAAGWMGSTASEAASGLIGADVGVAGWASDTGIAVDDVVASKVMKSLVPNEAW